MPRCDLVLIVPIARRTLLISHRVNFHVHILHIIISFAQEQG
jgi:hypothetical protein